VSELIGRVKLPAAILTGLLAAVAISGFANGNFGTAPLPQSGPPRQRLSYVVAPEGNEARYRVQEQLVGVDLPGDAVGRTSKIEGGIVIEGNGTIVKEESKFVVDLASLATDQQMRDNYVRRNTLQTEQHPRATFVPTAFRGLPSPIPTSGEVKFQLVGELTLRGITKPVTWEVTATNSVGQISGNATTRFKFGDFEMQQPRVRRVLSVQDDIRLEYDFRLMPKK
jgi:polyisoprenoid-binding protein YceI